MKKKSNVPKRPPAFFSKSLSSITKSDSYQPEVNEDQPKKLFIPALDSKAAILFWLGLAFFFSLYSVGIRVQELSVYSLTELAQMFMTAFVVKFCIIFSVVAVLNQFSSSYRHLSVMHASVHILLMTVIITVPATLVARLFLYVTFDIHVTIVYLIMEILVKIIMAVIICGLLLYYFTVQYNRINKIHEFYRQELTVQNEQLKARITPHFFFNMLNTLQHMVETRQEDPVSLIEHVAKLYRMSFDEPKEIGMIEELELCEHYLKIEHYRYGEKLAIHWELPDEDLLHDMVITSLTLQMVIEKMILFVVERTTQTTDVTVNIEWVNDIVTIRLVCILPENNEMITQEVKEELNFRAQEDMLQHFFSTDARIYYVLEDKQLVTYIVYPLKDIAI